jgi:hypothetical protein
VHFFLRTAQICKVLEKLEDHKLSFLAKYPTDSWLVAVMYKLNTEKQFREVWEVWNSWFVLGDRMRNRKTVCHQDLQKMFGNQLASMRIGAKMSKNEQK